MLEYLKTRVLANLRKGAPCSNYTIDTQHYNINTMNTTQTDTRNEHIDLAYFKEEEMEEIGELDLPPNNRPGKWYIVHTMSGAEKRVQDNLGELINTDDRRKGMVFEVEIPEEEVVEVKQNQKVSRSRKIFAGYVFVRCDPKKAPWSEIKDIPGVVGFAGHANPNNDPEPMQPSEVDEFLSAGKDTPVSRTRTRATYEVGSQLQIKDGPFAEFSGQVLEVNEEQFVVKLLVNIFGRETPVEVEFSQVRPL